MNKYKNDYAWEIDDRRNTNFIYYLSSIIKNSKICIILSILIILFGSISIILSVDIIQKYNNVVNESYNVSLLIESITMFILVFFIGLFFLIVFFKNIISYTNYLVMFNNEEIVRLKTLTFSKPIFLVQLILFFIPFINLATSMVLFISFKSFYLRIQNNPNIVPSSIWNFELYQLEKQRYESLK